MKTQLFTRNSTDITSPNSVYTTNWPKHIMLLLSYFLNLGRCEVLIHYIAWGEYTIFLKKKNFFLNIFLKRYPTHSVVLPKI